MTRDVGIETDRQIVLGLGGTVDYEICLEETIINDLVSELDISMNELGTVGSIHDIRDLLITILTYIQHGTGGEEFVSNSKDLINFSRHFKYTVSLGGTCVRAAIVQAIFGRSCIIHLTSISDEVRKLLPRKISYICSARKDTLDPHLIVQFREGFKVKIKDEIVKAPQPSRIIFTNDPPNRELIIAEELGEALSQAPLFLISGLNCIQDINTLEMRVKEIKNHMKKMPKEAIVVFEDAGYHLQAIRRRALVLLHDCLDIFSMNEDELRSYIERDLDLLNEEKVHEALVELAPKIPAPLLIIHSRFWSIAFGKASEKYRVHLQAAIDVASTRFCYGENLGRTQLRAVQKSPKHPDGQNFSLRLEARFSGRGICIPGYDLKVVNPTTIGLGDVFIGGLVGSISGIEF